MIGAGGDPPVNEPAVTASAEVLAPPPVLDTLSPGAISSQPLHADPMWMELLRNRFVIAGLGLVGILAIAAIVLVAIGSNDGDGANSAAASDTTPSAERTVVVRNGLPGKMLRTVSMRRGPGDEYEVIGTVPRRAQVAIIGRDEDSEWLQLAYPPGSRVRGWVMTEFVEVTGDIESLPIGEPGEGPYVPEPTYIPVETPIVVLPTEPVETVVPTEDATATEAVETPTSKKPTDEPTPTTAGGGGGNKPGRNKPR